MLIGLDALPDETSTSLRQSCRWRRRHSAHSTARGEWPSDRSEPKLLTGQTGAVTAIAFSLDGGRVLSGSDDKTARLWDAATGKMAAALEGHSRSITAVAFSPHGTKVLTGSEDETARLWPLFSSAQALVDEVKASVPRCLTPVQRESFHLGTPPPRWCAARNLWPFADAEPSPAGWDEWLLAKWDRAARWFGKARTGK